MSEERITRVTLEEARKMKGQTDWARVDALTDEDIERAVAEDPDAPPFWTDEDWANAQVVDPQKHTAVWLDRDIVGWFKKQGPHFQGRINDTLRAFIEARKRENEETRDKAPSEPSPRTGAAAGTAITRGEPKLA